jgi:hypothetical protein
MALMAAAAAVGVVVTESELKVEQIRNHKNKS